MNLPGSCIVYTIHSVEVCNIFYHLNGQKSNVSPMRPTNVFIVVSTRLKWVQMSQNGFKRVKTGSNAFKWVQIG